MTRARWWWSGLLMLIPSHLFHSTTKIQKVVGSTSVASFRKYINLNTKHPATKKGSPIKKKREENIIRDRNSGATQKNLARVQSSRNATIKRPKSTSIRKVKGHRRMPPLKKNVPNLLVSWARPFFSSSTRLWGFWILPLASLLPPLAVLLFIGSSVGRGCVVNRLLGKLVRKFRN